MTQQDRSSLLARGGQTFRLVAQLTSNRVAGAAADGSRVSVTHLRGGKIHLGIRRNNVAFMPTEDELPDLQQSQCL